LVQCHGCLGLRGFTPTVFWPTPTYHGQIYCPPSREVISNSFCPYLISYIDTTYLLTLSPCLTPPYLFLTVIRIYPDIIRITVSVIQIPNYPLRASLYHIHTAGWVQRSAATRRCSVCVIKCIGVEDGITGEAKIVARELA